MKEPNNQKIRKNQLGLSLLATLTALCIVSILAVAFTPGFMQIYYNAQRQATISLILNHISNARGLAIRNLSTVHLVFVRSVNGDYILTVLDNEQPDIPYKQANTPIRLPKQIKFALKESSILSCDIPNSFLINQLNINETFQSCNILTFNRLGGINFPTSNEVLNLQLNTASHDKSNPTAEPLILIEKLTGKAYLGIAKN